MLRLRDMVLLILVPWSLARADYDFWTVEQILNDSLAVYHGNVAVEVYQHDSLIFAYRSGSLAGDTTQTRQAINEWIAAALMLTRTDGSHGASDHDLPDTSLTSASDPWPAQSPYFAYGVPPTRVAGLWVTALQPESRTIEELAFPHENGSFVWLDHKRGLRGVLLTDAADRRGRAVSSELKIVHAIRDVMDCQLPVADLTINYVVNSGVELRWTGHFAGVYSIYSSDNPDRAFPNEWSFEGSIPAGGDILTVFVDPELQQEQAYYRIQRVCGK